MNSQTIVSDHSYAPDLEFNHNDLLEHDDIIEQLEEEIQCDEDVYFDNCEDSIDAEENNPSSNNLRVKNLRIWNNRDVSKRLVELNNELEPTVGRNGKFSKKKEMYAYIAKELYKEFGFQYTGQQVSSRLKNMFRKKYNKASNEDGKKNDNPLNEIDISKYHLESMYDDDGDDDDYVTDPEDKFAYNFSKMGFTNQQSKKLIRLFNMFIKNVGTSSQFRTQKDMWEAISEEIEYEFNVKFTAEQCYSRYKTIVRKAKQIIMRRNSRLSMKKMQKKSNLNTKTQISPKNTKMLSIFENNEKDDQSNSSMKCLQYENDDYLSMSDSQNEICKNETGEEYLEPNKINTFEQEFFKCADKNLIQQYIEFQETKAHDDLQRHNEIMTQLQSINETLLGMQHSGVSFANK